MRGWEILERPAFGDGPLVSVIVLQKNPAQWPGFFSTIALVYQ
jgi:hypothetical protein